MNQPEDMDRNEMYRAEAYRTEPAPGDLAGNPELHRTATRHEPRAQGSPLPTGVGQFRGTTPPGRALPGSGSEETSGMNRAMGALKQAMPFVQKLFPLIDGNFAAAVASLLTARPHTPPPPSVDLLPVQNQVSDLQMQQVDLRNQVVEQNASIKRVEDQLEMVREATDRNTLEQQELIEDLKSVGNKVNLLAWLLFLMLLISVLLNLALFLHINRVFP